MATPRRNIVLREFRPNFSSTVRPSNDYIETTDGSLLQEDYLVRTDSEGFLLTGNEGRGSTPIYILGDSFTEAVFEHEGQRFSDIFERTIIERNLDYRVLNGSYSRSTLLHIFNVFINKILRPNVVEGTTVLLFKPQIDVRVVNAPGSYWNEYGLFAPIFPANLQSEEITHDLDQDTDSGERLLHLMADACERFGIRLVFGTCPARNSTRQNDPILFKYFDSEEEALRRAEQRNSSNDLMRRVAKTRGLQLIDADHSFAGRTDLLYDYTHMNSAGQQHLADLLTSMLADKL